MTTSSEASIQALEELQDTDGTLGDRIDGALRDPEVSQEIKRILGR